MLICKTKQRAHYRTSQSHSFSITVTNSSADTDLSLTWEECFLTLFHPKCGFTLLIFNILASYQKSLKMLIIEVLFNDCIWPFFSMTYIWKQLHKCKTNNTCNAFTLTRNECATAKNYTDDIWTGQMPFLLRLERLSRFGVHSVFSRVAQWGEPLHNMGA